MINNKSFNEDEQMASPRISTFKPCYDARCKGPPHGTTKSDNAHNYNHKIDLESNKCYLFLFLLTYTK